MLQDMAIKTNPHEQNKTRVESNNKKECKTMQLTRSLNGGVLLSPSETGSELSQNDLLFLNEAAWTSKRLLQDGVLRFLRFAAGKCHKRLYIYIIYYINYICILCIYFYLYKYLYCIQICIYICM